MQSLVRLELGYKITSGTLPNIPDHNALQKRILELAEALSFYRDMMNNIPGHVYWLDKSNHYLGCCLEPAKNIALTNRLDLVGKTNNDIPWKATAKTVNQTSTHQRLKSSRSSS